jgi:hypothetical protein
MGGEAAVSSAPGSGSTFTVSLALAPAQPATGEAVPSSRACFHCQESDWGFL